MFNPADSETFWLNTTNLVLGLVTLGAILAVGYAIGREVLERVRARATVPATEATHTFMTPELGLTMADGGEPVDAAAKKSVQGKSKGKK